MVKNEIARSNKFEFKKSELKLRTFEAVANNENNLSLVSDILLGVGIGTLVIGVLTKMRLKGGRHEEVSKKAL